MMEAKSALLVTTSWVTQAQTHAHRHTDLHYNNKVLMQNIAINGYKSTRPQQFQLHLYSLSL